MRLLAAVLLCIGCGPAAPVVAGGAEVPAAVVHGPAERRADALRAARRAEGAGETAAAEAAWSRVRALDPGNGAAVYALACLRRRAGDDGATLALLDELEILEPGAGRGLLLRAELLLAPGDGRPPDPEAAAAAARRALRLNPEESGAHLALGRALAAGGRTEEAVARLRTAARMNPRDGESRSLLGVLLLRSGHGEEARAVLAEALAAAAGRVEAGRGGEFHGEGDTRASLAGERTPAAGELRAVAALAAMGERVDGVHDGGAPPAHLAEPFAALLRDRVTGEATLDLDGDGTADAAAVTGPDGRRGFSRHATGRTTSHVAGKD